MTLIRRLSIVLMLQLSTVPIVILIFKLIEEKRVAGLVAGVFFLSLTVGLFLFLRRGKNSQMLGTSWFALLFLALVAVPMVYKRATNFDLPFEQIEIWGISGPEFHRLSERVFLILVVMTLMDLFRAKYLDLKQKPS
jgi:hypothetical protein